MGEIDMDFDMLQPSKTESKIEVQEEKKPECACCKRVIDKAGSTIYEGPYDGKIQCHECIEDWRLEKMFKEKMNLKERQEEINEENVERAKQEAAEVVAQSRRKVKAKKKAHNRQNRF